MPLLNREDLKIDRPFWAIEPSEVTAILDTPNKGLSVEEAERRLKWGENRIQKAKRAGKLKILLSQLLSPLIIILLTASLITIFLKDYKDTIFILVAVLVNTLLGFYQENKAESALAKLESYIREISRVIRGGRDMEISAEEIVPGDILKLTPGTRISADARIIRANSISTDEAILTGESLSVEKSARIVETETELADRTSMVYGGTLVVGGSGLAVVTATGAQTELGKIAELVRDEPHEKTPLQKAINKFSINLSIILGIFIVLLFTFGIYAGIDVLDMFLTSVAVAVSVVPEGLPIALTVILAVGVERLAKKRGVVRKLLAAETLGSTTIILTDKTGTLTEAKMDLVDIISDKPEKIVLELAILNTDVIIGNPIGAPKNWQLSGHPIHVAIIKSAIEKGLMPADVFKRNEILETTPFNSKDKFAAVHAKLDNRSRWVYLGAPDYLLEQSNAPTSFKEEMSNNINELAFSGHRILGVSVDNNFTALLVFKDPVRPSVKEAISEVKDYGVRTVIVTGDHLGTAISVANELGLNVREGEAIVGKELKLMTDEELELAKDKIKVYARVTPSDKLRITEMYKKMGEVVAVTGDGINDAPALKGANIGIAVGSGSDVAKGASDLILLDDNFETIVEAVKEGRRILENIKKVIVYLLSGILDELILIGGALLVGVALPLNALQILWVNFFADSFPAVALAFEKGSGGSKRKSTLIRGKLLDDEMKFLIWVIGVATSVMLLFIYFYLLAQGYNPQMARTFIFASFSVYTLFLIFSIKSLSDSIFTYNPFSNMYLVLGTSIGFLLTALAIYVPLLQDVLDTVSLPVNWLLGVLAVGVVNIVAIEFGKFLFRIRDRV
ncbi:MAG: hypothetical protein COT89_01405 [Candidatus Colwellbacteria bacterium CG10_big_fil_rev_8_21_14_0_10_42_22]|uniref:Cation-transporting P-type ATPase N-terminal domain-containing protein n=1 Tax=Candidatus Colwellbacteria bacterium CG10_big_fil_rev_8_21_14_0_10_42_22 TaxID=1974540 RepID=A0A2H0VG56_9BACT|nr:MAG: hypothetical protein COT89_01405 [Candidatus Colwellbacteria bacterium CG10_big_fil_rev_8_21_14_0_10_42_22]